MVSDSKSHKRRRDGRRSAREPGGLSPWWGALAGLVVLVLVGAVVLQRSRRPTPRVADAVAQTSAEQAVQRIGAKEAAERVDRGLATLYDVRTPAEFEAARAAGARLFAESEREALVGELPADGDLIFY